MRELILTAASFALMVTLFAGLSGTSTITQASSTPRTAPVGGPVLVRIPEAAAGSDLSAYAVFTDDAGVEYERAWIAPRVEPAMRDVGVFGRLRSDLKLE